MFLGFYSDRLFNLSKNAKKIYKNLTTIDVIDWKEINSVKKKYDWVWACYVETSIGLKLPIEGLKKLANRTGAKLALDATASIGLEKNHQLADAVTFSSCKGLFGLTGGAFIAYKQKPKNKINFF